VTRELEAVVMRGLERDPSKRFATAREMAIALESQSALATPIEVGAWVERVAGVTLAQRAERVAAIEAEFGQAVRAAPAGASVELAPHRPAAASLTGATSATVAVPGLARTDDKTTVDVGGELTRTGVVSVSDLSVPRRRTRLVSAATVIGAGALLGIVLMVRASTHGSPDQAASAALASAAAIDSATTPPLPAPPSDSVAPDQAPEERPTSETFIRRAPPPASPAVRKRAVCSPAYTIDARGVRHYKPECL
jgi:serine/threonine-protein kinase